MKPSSELGTRRERRDVHESVYEKNRENACMRVFWLNFKFKVFKFKII